ncbi:DegT/DnrJ/EryC1/StrS aminotransferase family protein [Alphaproteobacteria bacterium]|nr:DegT/DnrJ/EryC1/StrS aminotransferase family protein [Alphaproteobacteria bacterium]
MKNLPLMRNNIPREDLDLLIEHLSKEDPILTNGANCRMFEEEWSNWLGVKYSVFVNSGSSANLLSMSVLRQMFPDGGEIIVPPLTWVSDIASVIQTGFDPVFVDIDLNTLAMNPRAIIEKATPRTRAVFLSHIQGFNGLSDELLDELERREIPLIEDVCESHGASHGKRRLGSFGLMSNFSFYYAHHISTIEGGMICTNDKEVYQSLRMLRSHGLVRESDDETLKKSIQSKYPDLNPQFVFMFPAYNVRNTELGGILGRAQLKRLDAVVKKRADNHTKFVSGINSRAYFTDFLMEGASNYAFNLILREPNKSLMDCLESTLTSGNVEYRRGSAGGGNQIRQPYLRNFVKNSPDEFPNTEHVHFFGMYIGNFPDLGDDEIDYIIDLVNECASRFYG